MYVPYAHERVFRKGRMGTYLVVWVDFYHQNVSLVPIKGELAKLVENVPFSELEPMDRVSSSSAQSRLRETSDS